MMMVVVVVVAVNVNGQSFGLMTVQTIVEILALTSHNHPDLSIRQQQSFIDV